MFSKRKNIHVHIHCPQQNYMKILKQKGSENLYTWKLKHISNRLWAKEEIKMEIRNY